VNPTTEELMTSFAPASPGDLEDILRKSQSAFEEWRATNINKRAVLLVQLSEVLERKSKELARLMTTEMGKPIEQSLSEIKKCAWVCRYFAEVGPKLLVDDVRATDATRSYVRREPLGSILAIMPWNFPFWQVFRNAATSLLAGNAMILKHAANTPQCALAIQSVFDEANANVGLFQNVFASHEQLAKLIADDRIRGVTLTGSNQAGEIVGALAGKYVKKVVLELGGSDPFIVLDDVNIDDVAEKAALGRCLNNGQSCIAAKRFIVDQAIVDQFTETFVAAMKSRVIGDPLKAETQIGPLATQAQRDLIERQVNDATSKGAKVLCGGARLKGPGWFFPPTVLSDLTPAMRAFQEELFAPVACIYPFESISEAIAIANATPFGLGASLWTRDSKRVDEFISELECGSVFVNAMVHSDPRLPFGGVKASGVGRELGPEGLFEFVNQKTVWIA